MTNEPHGIPPDDEVKPLSKDELRRLEDWANATLQNLGLTKTKVQRLSDSFKPLSKRLFLSENPHCEL